MKHFLLFGLFLILGLSSLSAQEHLVPLRRMLHEQGGTSQDRAHLWDVLKARLYPIKDISEEHLEKNLETLYFSLLLLLAREPLWSGNIYLVEIAQDAEEHYLYAQKLMREKRNKMPANFLLNYGRVMMLITPIMNRIDRSSPLLHPVRFILQYSAFERLFEISRSLLKKDKENVDNWMFLAEIQVVSSNHKTMVHSALAKRYLDYAIKEYTRLDRSEDLAWAYLWQSSLFMRRSLNREAQESIQKAQELFPRSFLVEAAANRFRNGLPFM